MRSSKTRRDLSLSRYVRRVMKEKRLSQRDVQRRSGTASSGISDGYLADLLSGRARNVSVDKMEALARGLGVDVREVFEAARGASETSQESASTETDLASFAAMIREIADRPDLMALMKEAVGLSARDCELVLRAIRFLNLRTDGRRRDKRG